MNQLINYYQVKSAAWLGYAGIVWNRFNWLLTLQLAMAGFFLTNHSKIDSTAIFQFHIPTIGLIVAFLWFIMGIEDFRSMNKHRNRVKNLEKQIEDELTDSNNKTNHDEIRKSFFRQTYLLFFFPTITITSWLVIMYVD